MRRRVFLAGAGAALAAPGVLRAGPAVGALARDFVAAQGVPGVSWAYRAADGRMETGAAGFADPEAGEALTPAHRLRIASISKPLTAAVVLSLAAEESLATGQRVFGPDGILRGDLPEGGVPAAERLAAVKVDHLLTHTAGGWSNRFFDPVFLRTDLEADALVRHTLGSIPLVADPGTAYAYSNFGYLLLGRIIEAVTGQGYAEAVTARLLRPAGATSFALAGDRLEDRLEGEAVYVSAGQEAYGFRLDRGGPFGGWVATPSDLTLVLAAMDGEGDDVFPSGVASRMATPWKAGAFYGRGLVVSPEHGNRWHDGGLPGLTSLAVMVEGGEVIAAIANGQTEGTLAALEAFLWQAYDLLHG